MRDWIFAHLMRLASRRHEPMVAARKRRLLGGLSGKVLEIGPGDGVNLQYYGAGVEWLGYEPNGWLARRIAVPAGGRLENGPYLGGEQAETVVCSLVLCSVKDLRQMLRWIWESLPEGGRLVFLEHVAAAEGTEMRSRQERWAGVWSCCAGGCQITRDTARVIGETGFVIEELEAFDLPLPLAGPHVCGVARKRVG